MVRAGTAYRKVWRLVNNFFCSHNKVHCSEIPMFWVIFCIIIFFIELWHILILWLAEMPNGGMPVFTLIATGWRYREIFFYKKTLHFAAAVMRDTNLNAQDCVTCNFNCIVSKLKDFSRSVAHICTEKLVISISKTVPDNIWVVTAVY